ncbi:MAG: hypothetical protein RR911_05955 [Oscillospiraceae bacterium]
MLQTILKDLKFASVAGRAIGVISIVQKLIVTAVIVVFATQIGKFILDEKMKLSS